MKIWQVSYIEVAEICYIFQLCKANPVSTYQSSFSYSYRSNFFHCFNFWEGLSRLLVSQACKYEKNITVVERQTRYCNFLICSLRNFTMPKAKRFHITVLQVSLLQPLTTCTRNFKNRLLNWCCKLFTDGLLRPLQQADNPLKFERSIQRGDIPWVTIWVLCTFESLYLIQRIFKRLTSPHQYVR